MTEEIDDGKYILTLPMEENDSGAATIKGYLVKLLDELWAEGEGFSGKRPFGNSGWEYDLYKPLVQAEVVPGKLDENGYIEEVDSDLANKLIFAAIHAL
jgi:hypothetical protein